jgi:hypothetical protein
VGGVKLTLRTVDGEPVTDVVHEVEDLIVARHL